MSIFRGLFSAFAAHFRRTGISMTPRERSRCRTADAFAPESESAGPVPSGIFRRRSRDCAYLVPPAAHGTPIAS
jgi:hypothetical protein